MTDSSRRLMITGVSGDIGGYLVRHFQAAGADVLGLDRRRPDSGLLSPERFREVDLSCGSDAVTAIDDLWRTHGPCHALINCAGAIANAPLVSLRDGTWQVHDFATFRHVVDASLTTTFHASALVARQMLAARRPGVIVNISSICARGNAGQAAYSAAKAGVEGLTRALAKELGPVRIRVVGIAPGFFDTPSTRAHLSDDQVRHITQRTPLRRLGTLNELADVVTLALDNAFLNGAIIDVSAGLTV